MATNPIVHWELMGPDGDAQKAFYGSIFDWSFESMDDFEGYHMVGADSSGIGGAVGQGSEEMPSYLTIYVQVESIDDSLAEIETQGGKGVVPRTEIPGVVTYALFADPAGNTVGLVEAGTT